MAKIVFMGDSITEYIPYIFKGQVGNSDDEIKYYGVENIGVGSYMRYCWPKIQEDNVDYYVLLIGTNNISRPDCDYDNRESLDDLVEKLKEFINLITTNSESKLIVQSIYPTKHESRRKDILFVNKCLKEFCNSINVDYIDIYSLLRTDSDLLNEEYSDDGIHPNNKGYEIILNHIYNYILLNYENIKKKEKTV